MFEPPSSVRGWNAPREVVARSGGGDPDGPIAWLRRVLRPRRGAVDHRVLVVGTVGTGTVTERLQAVLDRRGTAARAVTVEDGDPPGRERDGRGAVETLIVEGAGGADAVQAARDLLGPPDVVVVTAVGKDGVTARGPGRGDAVRSIASSVPRGAHVVNAEASPAIRRYLATAVERRGATIAHVGAHDVAAPGAELASAVDGALAALEEPPMPDEEREALAAASEPEWLALPGGRVYDALGVTDVVAIERLRRALAGDREPVELVAVLPRERRDVAALLADYAGECHERRLVSTVHALGPRAKRFGERCPAPTVAHRQDETAEAVVRRIVGDDPTMIVGAGETPTATALSSAIMRRMERSDAARIG